MEPGGLARFSRTIDALVSLAFLCAVCLPLLGTVCLPSSFDPAVENRRPAEFPDLSMESPADFPASFEKAFSDRFAFRSRLVHLASLASVGLGVSTSPQVVLGRDGWLFYSGENELELFRRSAPFTRGELVTWAEHLDARRAWLAARGIRYLLLVAPNKETIYPEKMPPEFEAAGRLSRLDQLVQFLGKHSEVPVVDVRTSLWKAAERESVYAHTDTHWNDLGAFAAYHEVATRLGDWFPSIHPLERADMVATAMWARGGDLSSLLSLRDELPERNVVLLRPANPKARPAEPGVSLPAGAGAERTPLASEIADPTRPRAVLLGDSFMIGVRPFLAEHFQRSLFLNTQEFPTDVIEREHPDVVVHEMLERLLNRDPPEAPTATGSEEPLR